jgi:hypothetical protein
MILAKKNRVYQWSLVLSWGMIAVRPIKATDVVLWIYRNLQRGSCKFHIEDRKAPQERSVGKDSCSLSYLLCRGLLGCAEYLIC